MTQRVIIYNLNNPDVRVEIAKAHDPKDAVRIMRLFQSGKGWNINRRPHMDTFDDVVLTFENVPRMEDEP